MANTKPNVLIIMTDQHRSDYMGCTRLRDWGGNMPAPTPNIDKIAGRGVRFKNAYCAYPVCLASRSAMLTGLYAHTTGADTNQDVLDRRYRTMAHHFASNGYYTGLIGKMHFNNACNHGFDFYMSINDWLMYLGPKVQYYADEIGSHQISPQFYWTVDDDGAGFPDLRNVWIDGKSPWIGHVNSIPPEKYASAMAEEDHMESFIARESVKFLELNGKQPFFLVASFMKPHTPFHPPAKYAEMYPADSIKLKDPGDLSEYPDCIRKMSQNFSGFPEVNRKSAIAGYLGNLAFVDTRIGYLYDSLERLGLLENTIVIYTSDHGEMDGDHGIYQKFCMFDPSVKMPLIVSWPGHYGQNVVSDRLINQIGLYPTLVDLTGTGPVSCVPLAPMDNAPAGLDAESWAGKVLHPLESDSDDEDVFSEYRVKNYSQSEFMVRDKKYKYIYYRSGGDVLFDLEKDPGEFINLAKRSGYTEIIKTMRMRLLKYIDIKFSGEN
ncbi:MAG: sulfatase-like hydrolase/transferase [Treponema sp.]|nr:sulfatase-like hydrolase/transferase [Treponema sp.]